MISGSLGQNRISANSSVFDSEERIVRGSEYITVYQKNFHGCFFESKDKPYTPAGWGAPEITRAYPPSR